jgi:transcriptional regulator with XRE-family HTH domain
MIAKRKLSHEVTRIGEAVRQYRFDRGMTGVELAKATGVSAAIINMTENRPRERGEHITSRLYCALRDTGLDLTEKVPDLVLVERFSRRPRVPKLDVIPPPRNPETALENALELIRSASTQLNDELRGIAERQLKIREIKERFLEKIKELL